MGKFEPIRDFSFVALIWNKNVQLFSGFSSGALSAGAIIFTAAVFTGIGVATVISVIPDYLPTRDPTIAGESQFKTFSK